MSYGIYIGKNHTADGIAYLAGYGDEPSSHWLELVGRQTHDEGAAVKVGVTADADLPGVMGEIPQDPETARHLCVNYTYYKGTPAPLTNGGLNQHGVAVRDIWSPSRPELSRMTPKDQAGPNYSDLARLVLQRARSAREGVMLMGDIMARHGHTTYGGNSHIIADSAEAWVVIQFSGGQGLWAAERLDDDTIRASRPGYILDIPIDQPDHPDFLYSPNLVDFAISQGWYDSAKGEPFNANAIYGDGKGRWDGVAWIEGEMTARAARPEKVSIEDVMWAIRTERLTGDTAGYGQVVPLADTHADLRMLWHTQIGPVAAQFVPVFMGISEVPAEFRMHRYLTDGEAATFLDDRKAADQVVSAVPQSVEATRSATYVFKRLLNLAFQRKGEMLPELIAVWNASEKRLLAEIPAVIRTARTLIDAGEPALATRFLTYFSSTELMKALDGAEKLGDALDIRIRALHGISGDVRPSGPEQIW